MPTHLEHTTRESGHTRLSPRAEGADEVIAHRTPLFQAALDSGHPVGLPANGWLAAR